MTLTKRAMVGKDDLETYEAVNRCETFDELAEVILSIGSNVLTRRWGIRQQAMYIKHYSS